MVVPSSVLDVQTKDSAAAHGCPAFCRYYGREFPLAFALAVEAAGIRHRYIQPRRPQQNGKVERSYRIDHEVFWSRHAFSDFDTATTALRAWERTRNPASANS
jgi:transposase InsO family protein